MLDTQPRALIADADRASRLLVSRHLHTEGFDIGECGDGREALERIASAHFDLIVLDAALPGLDGIALCRAIRQSSPNSHAGIFIVSTAGTESDKVLALVNGADDYLTKPLGMREFLARVAAIMRRAQHSVDRCMQASIARGDVRLDPARRQVIVRGAAVACSKQEFDVLYALASRPGIVFSREALLAKHWSATDGAMGIRLVDPIISRLRRKIERYPDAPQLIITVWGVGYKFSESEI